MEDILTLIVQFQIFQIQEQQQIKQQQLLKLFLKISKEMRQV